METIQGFDFFHLPFDNNGKLTDAQALADLKSHAAEATDAIFIAHGFRNDENDATTLYTNFLASLRAHFDGTFHAALGSRKFVVAGVYWPSKPFKEANALGGSAESLDAGAAGEDPEEADVRQTLQEMLAEADASLKPNIARAIELLDKVNERAAQDEFVKQVMTQVPVDGSDELEGAEKVRATDGSELLDKLGAPAPAPTSTQEFDSFDEGGTEGIGSFFGSIFGKIGEFLNLTLWYVMKSRSGTVGATGAAQAVRDLHAAAPSVRIHLVGHSLGGRLMAACSKTLTQDPVLQPDSLTLLEAAFSHYGLSADNGQGKAGFFRSLLAPPVVKGPFFSTFSAQDSVVGKVYAITSRLALDDTEAVGDAKDLFGGIGRNGAQRTIESQFEPLLKANSGTYRFPLGKVLCLDGSGGLIKDHGDVTNADVTYAFASALIQTGVLLTVTATT
jgi:hypothetical protein